ncbi:MAG TPA: MFS transporter [Burkholderiales bacterium]|nr:MFS transporter [Burkholderiales bacterium]
MSPVELRASVSLAAIFGLRLLGMFIILPVFAIYAEQLPGGHDLTLVGIAIGAYGLTQAALQIPFGWWSDRYGRKPVIYVGLAIFAAGSFIAAAAASIYLVIVGRVLQGAGAISAAVMAMAADLTREEHRTKAMAMIGSTIGLAFAFSLVASPWLAGLIGVPGLFAMTGALALAAMLVVWRVVPDIEETRRPSRGSALREFWHALSDPQLARLNYGIFVLHAVLMSLFIVVPFSLRDAGLPLPGHWKVYLPAMLGSFVLMLPAVLGRSSAQRLKPVFIGSIAVLLAAHLALPWLAGGVASLTLFLLFFFTPFNVLEAMLPSLTSRLAPAHSKGIAIGLYSSVQFFGTFFGAAAGGFLYEHWGTTSVVIANAALLVIWIIAAAGMRPQGVLSLRTYSVPPLDAQQAQRLAARLQALAGVREARVIAEERTASLMVDSTAFDEHNVLQAIASQGELTWPQSTKSS